MYKLIVLLGLILLTSCVKENDIFCYKQIYEEVDGEFVVVDEFRCGCNPIKKQKDNEKIKCY